MAKDNYCVYVCSSRYIFKYVYAYRSFLFLLPVVFDVFCNMRGIKENCIEETKDIHYDRDHIWWAMGFLTDCVLVWLSRCSWRETSWRTICPPSAWSTATTCCWPWPSPSRTSSPSDSWPSSATAPSAGRRSVLQTNVFIYFYWACSPWQPDLSQTNAIPLYMVSMSTSLSHFLAIFFQMSQALEKSRNPALSLCPISSPHSHIKAYLQGK